MAFPFYRSRWLLDGLPQPFGDRLVEDIGADLAQRFLEARII
jgi:hypothetical protein